MIPYVFTIGCLINEMLCVRLDVCFIIRIESRYQSYPLLKLWAYVKHTFNYLKKTREYMLVSLCNELVLFRVSELRLSV